LPAIYLSSRWGCHIFQQMHFIRLHIGQDGATFVAQLGVASPDAACSCSRSVLARHQPPERHDLKFGSGGEARHQGHQHHYRMATPNAGIAPHELPGSCPERDLQRQK